VIGLAARPARLALQSNSCDVPSNMSVSTRPCLRMAITWPNQANVDPSVACRDEHCDTHRDSSQSCDRLPTATQHARKPLNRYRTALALRPDYADAWNNLGNVFRDQGLEDEATTCYRRAIELRPGFARACYNLGVALAEQMRGDEALRWFNEALRIDPAFTEAW